MSRQFELLKPRLDLTFSPKPDESQMFNLTFFAVNIQNTIYKTIMKTKQRMTACTFTLMRWRTRRTYCFDQFASQSIGSVAKAVNCIALYDSISLGGEPLATVEPKKHSTDFYLFKAPSYNLLCRLPIPITESREGRQLQRMTRRLDNNLALKYTQL
jgi:hypothetical protein